MTENSFREELIPVSDLDVDRAVQRTQMDVRKVERIVRNYNPAALGVITVSERGPVNMVIIDGMHRTEATRRVTDGQGRMLSHVFKGLTIAEEAQMFLDLNAGTQPSLVDKFRVRLTAEDPIAKGINDLVHAFGWVIAPTMGTGSIQCVGTVEKIYVRSLAGAFEPNLLHFAIMTISRAWGKNSKAPQANIMEGLALFAEEYGQVVQVDTFIRKLANYPGGPEGLITDGRQIAAMKRRRVPLGVAERLVDEYNVGSGRRKLLAPWRRAR